MNGAQGFRGGQRPCPKTFGHRSGTKKDHLWRLECGEASGAGRLVKSGAPGGLRHSHSDGVLQSSSTRYDQY